MMNSNKGSNCLVAASSGIGFVQSQPGNVYRRRFLFYCTQAVAPAIMWLAEAEAEPSENPVAGDPKLDVLPRFEAAAIEAIEAMGWWWCPTKGCAAAAACICP